MNKYSKFCLDLSFVRNALNEIDIEKWKPCVHQELVVEPLLVSATSPSHFNYHHRHSANYKQHYHYRYHYHRILL